MASSEVSVSAAATSGVSASSALAMPKSSSLTWPASVTSTLEGLRSRCTSSCWCAWANVGQLGRGPAARAGPALAGGIDGPAADALHHRNRAGHPPCARRPAGGRCAGARAAPAPAAPPQSAPAPRPSCAPRTTFDGSLAGVGAVGPLGQPDLAHAAAPQRSTTRQAPRRWPTRSVPAASSGSGAARRQRPAQQTDARLVHKLQQRPHLGRLARLQTWVGQRGLACGGVQQQS